MKKVCKLAFSLYLHLAIFCAYILNMSPTKSQFLLGLFSAVSAQAPSGVPSFVTEFAPIVHLYSVDPYRPSDIGAQVVNTQPEVNFTTVTGEPNPLTLDNLNQLNNDGQVYLTSISNPTTTPGPAYLYGVAPDAQGKTNNATSCAIIVVDHGNGAVDAFYMYFYAFNFGGLYLDNYINIGNHVGDWEHNMVRFGNGTPTAIWFSQHSGGQAFSYKAAEKYNGGVRVRILHLQKFPYYSLTLFQNQPVTYSANGTHANYAIPGTHDHTIPGLNLPVGPIEDHTDAGPVWDPTLAAYYYTYNTSTSKFTAYNSSSTPVNWLYFTGNWGDEEYPQTSPRQHCIFGIDALCQWTGGPTGPLDKDLNRKNVCPSSVDVCIVLDVLVAKKL